MNCQQCRDELAAYLEGLLDETSQSRIESHLAECSACMAEFDEVRRLAVHLARDALVEPPVSLETVVMDRILQEQARQIRRLKMRKRIRVLGLSGAMAAAAAMFVISGLWLAQPATAQKAAETLARGAEAARNPSTVHIVAKMRTPPGDNFATIVPEADLTTIEAWRQFGDKPKWRLEEPGRVIVMDGASAVQLMRQANLALKMPPRADGWGPVFDLTNVQDMITRQLRTALAKGWDLRLTHETTPKGERKLLVTVEAKSGLPENDYLRNKSLDLSDARFLYRFDAKTQRLEEMEAHLHQPSGDLLVLQIERIEYDQPIDPALFVLQLPENVRWLKPPEQLPDNERYAKMTPLEAARTFFEACAKEDWKEAEKFWNSSFDDRIKNHLGGLQIISLGKPFQSKVYAGGRGWFIPYEIKLKDGTVRKHNLAMRNDNAGKRYVVDGGI
jgi:outer membrane lipoprotein-sorting protein